jgi:8-oxo-dGTP pyrophosphatase MutT (NUDIX family)
MTYLFDEEFRQLAAARCSDFQPLPDASSVLLKRAAVAVVIVQADNGADAAILLTRRAQGLRAHSGQWALPGGRCDEGETPAKTALRELDEELGAKLGEGSVLGLLDDYTTRSGYIIKPVVIWAEAETEIRPNPQEVESVHRVPLASIASPDALSFIAIPQSDKPVIRIRVGSRFVHAPTAAVVYQFLELLAGRTTRVRDYEQPVFAWK